MEMLIYQILLLLVLVIKKSVICFNLDDQFPIIYEAPADQRNSYFGYSVILGPTTGSTNDKLDSWILIGAPRGNSSYRPYKYFKEPGIVFQCKFKGKCTEKVEFTRSSTDHAWVGAAMDIDKDFQNYAVCGHRWMKTSKNNNFLFGACYLSINKQISLTVPLIKEESVSSDGVLVYGMAQAGTSVHFSKQNELVLGAPGFYLWHGIPLYFENAKSKKSVKAVFRLYSAADSFSYQGYQVSSGKFFSQNKLLYVASAPRSDRYKGKVVLYDLNTGGQQLVQHDRYTIIRGEQIGSYFGASLAVTDINSDNFDDLIIGAPFYSKDWDEGRVYVYLGSNYDFHPNVQKLDGFTPGGRFGTSLMALGDINGDNYKDLAVGAPYDEDHGVVYIFNGQKSEPYLKLSQKLVAKDIYSGLNGFGISISRPADVDNNKYSDIAVGAHKSGHVVIFRSKPVVKLTCTLSISKSSLSFTDKSFNIMVCQSYSGHNLPNSIEVLSVLTIDPKLARFYFQGKSKNDFIYERKVNITVTSTNCEKMTVIKKDGVKNFDHPIFISLNQNLTQDIKEKNRLKSVIIIKGNGDVIGKDNFNKVKPILSSDSQFETYAQIPFSKGCQSEKCNVTLQLQLEISNDTYIIGSGGIVDLSIIIKNTGETAYPVEVSINSPFDQTMNLAIICPNNTNHNLTSESCVFFNPFENGHHESALIKIDMSQFDMLNKSENVILEFVAISGHEPNPKFKNSTKINFVYDADLILTGKPKQEIYLLVGNESVKEIEFQQIYAIENFGQSNVAKIELIIDIPTSVDGISFHQLNYNGKLNKQNFHCHYSSELTLKEEMAKISNLVDTGSLKHNINKRSTNNSFTNLNQKSSMNQTTTGVSQNVDLPSTRTLFLNCSDNSISCSRLSCHIGPFMDTSRATLQLHMKLNISGILQKLIQTKDIIYFSTNGSINEQRSIAATVATTFNIGFEKEKLDWIKTTVFSVLISIMILIVLTGILMKAGFFQRKKKEEMEKLKEQLLEAEITRESHFEEISDASDGTNEMELDNEPPGYSK